MAKKPTRFRFRKAEDVRINLVSGERIVYETPNEYIWDLKHGPGPCEHFKVTKREHTITTKIPGKEYSENCRFTGFGGNFSPGYFRMMEAIQRAMRYDWSKMPTSSAFGLIQILAEMDDTVATLAMKVADLRYGSVSWGVLPIISDIKALANTVMKLYKYGLGTFDYENVTEESIDPSVPPVNGWKFAVCTGGSVKLRLAGKARLPEMPFPFWALDIIGFHPDLATAWDLVPLSFLVDRIVPFGRMFDYWRGGGWVKGMWFEGWGTTQAIVNCAEITNHFNYNTSESAFQLEYYARQPMGMYLEFPDSGDTRDKFKYSADFPDLTSIFDIYYVMSKERRI